MGFLKAVQRRRDDAEYEFKRIAADMAQSFKLMHNVRNYMPDTVLEQQQKTALCTIDAIECIKTAAIAYDEDRIELGQAHRAFNRAIPALMNFLIFDISVDEKGELRDLPRDVSGALAEYAEKPTIENAGYLIGECVNSRNLNTHWMFDNVARAVQFCGLATVSRGVEF